MSDYKTKNKLEEYFHKNGDNWILSEEHNSSHIALSENSDILKDRIYKLTSKMGIEGEEKKSSAYPIYQGTSYVKSGTTFTDALSLIDSACYDLEVLFFSTLIDIARQGALEWIINTSDKAINIVSIDNTDYEGPSPLKVLDLNSFLWIINNHPEPKIFYGSSLSQLNWPTYSKSVHDIIGVLSANEVMTSSSILFGYDGRVDLVAGIEEEQTSTLETTYENIIVRSPGTINYDTSSMVFTSETVGPANLYANEIFYLKPYLRYIINSRIEYDNILYFIPTVGRNATYSSRRAERISNTKDVIVYSFSDKPIGFDRWNYRTWSTGIYIEGITSFSYMDIKPAQSGRYGMVVADETGSLYYRVSVDGKNWYEDSYFESSSRAVPSIIIDSSLVGSDYDVDYATFLPMPVGGALCFFNTNYTQGVKDNIHHAFYRPGDTSWTIPYLTLGITGVFPTLFSRDNGDIYLCYHSEEGINVRQIITSFSRTYTAGGQ